MDKRKKSIRKVITDLLLIPFLVICFFSSHVVKGHRDHSANFSSGSDDFSWLTLHSISSIIFSLIIVIHILQHWAMIKGIAEKRLYSKNLTSTLTLITFVVTVLSYIVYINGFSHSKGEFHGTIANLFLIIAVVHLFLNFRKMLVLFRKRAGVEVS
ncbi:MAG TPA: hypothetical protein VHO46_00460 [Bacteroidales bacterium]|nr:hypothetical protein [Bacteroidales bacterium]